MSPSAQQRAAGLAVPLDWFRWVTASAVALFRPSPPDLRRSLLINRRGEDVTPRAFLDRSVGPGRGLPLALGATGELLVELADRLR